jgi:hypothetical protein
MGQNQLAAMRPSVIPAKAGMTGVNFCGTFAFKNSLPQNIQMDL